MHRKQVKLPGCTHKPYKPTQPGSVGDAERVLKQGKPLPKGYFFTIFWWLVVVIQSDANSASDCISGVPVAQTERKKKKKRAQSLYLFFFFFKSGLEEAVNHSCESHRGKTNGTIIFPYTFPRGGDAVAS